jgi:hypothetical protein
MGLANFSLIDMRKNETGQMKRLPHACVILAVVAVTAAPAQARSLQIAGTAGYLAEWALSGVITETAGNSSEFFGPLVVKHVGLCSMNGEQEKPGTIRFNLSSAGASSLMHATLSLGNASCTYTGAFTDQSTSGAMDCSDAQGVPLSISVK